ncbi:hypothetical protein QE152_g12554 [Popillia japonica]|uniref:Uncharacterized protein n=1 Tax=Popillia japonica TaxID=7064 RepID=A0AAW1LSP9_POPJA
MIRKGDDPPLDAMMTEVIDSRTNVEKNTRKEANRSHYRYKNTSLAPYYIVETHEKDGDECEKPIKRANCDKGHYSTDKACEAFRLQKEIKTRMAIDNITFWEAKNKISGGRE